MPDSSATSRGSAPGSAPSPGDALRAYASSELDDAIAGLGWRGGRIHAGVHRARKALRRARATLALGGDALGPGAGLVDRELRRLNRGLSSLRDAQALVEMLERRLQAQHSGEALQALRRARRVAMTRRAAAAREAQAGPDLQTRRELLVALRGALDALPWACLTESRLQAAMASSLERVLGAQAKAGSSGDDGDWHRWRRRARRVSQQRRALAAAGIAPEVDLPKLGKRIAVQLGRAQDFSLLLAHCGRGSPFMKADRKRLAQLAETGLRERRRGIAGLGAAFREQQADPLREN